MRIRSLALGALFLIPATAQAAEQRCGWLVNPTPANFTLIDKDGEWVIGTQGGHQADGDTPSWPDNSKDWVAITPERGYGHGCACLTVEVDAAKKEVTKIVASSVRPLTACRADKALSGTEPKYGD